MGHADGVFGVHPGVGGISERDYRDAHRDSRARNVHAQSGGKNVGEASQALRSKGLILRVADRVYSDVPINQVVRQTPPPGMLMKVSQQAHVVLSLGQRELEIPPLEGNTLRVSRIELLRGGLQVGEVSTVVLPDEPTDTVVHAEPEAGQRGGNAAGGRAGVREAERRRRT